MRHAYPSLVDPCKPNQRLLDTQLVALEHRFIRLAQLPRNPQRPARRALVSLAHLAFRPLGPLALAVMAHRSPHLDPVHVPAVAVRAIAVSGRSLRTRLPTRNSVVWGKGSAERVDPWG